LLGKRVPAHVVTVVMALAMLAAPFLAFLYHPAAGLVVMAVALATAAFLAHGALAFAPPPARRWLRVAIVVNAVLAVVCVIAAGWVVG
jgi:hypothetical protein